MSDCCSAPYAKLFGRKQARRDARRFRRKGLDSTARGLVDAVAGRGIEGASVTRLGRRLAFCTGKLVTREKTIAQSTAVFAVVTPTESSPTPPRQELG